MIVWHGYARRSGNLSMFGTDKHQVLIVDAVTYGAFVEVLAINQSGMNPLIRFYEY